jgi:hypothetical protein
MCAKKADTASCWYNVDTFNLCGIPRLLVPESIRQTGMMKGLVFLYQLDG